MKTLTDLIVNELNQDVIITHYARECMTPENKVIWVDEKNAIAKCHQDCILVTIYLKSGDGTSIADVIDIRASSIKQLYKLITEIESHISEEFID